MRDSWKTFPYHFLSLPKFGMYENLLTSISINQQGSKVVLFLPCCWRKAIILGRSSHISSICVAKRLPCTAAPCRHLAKLCQVLPAMPCCQYWEHMSLLQSPFAVQTCTAYWFDMVWHGLTVMDSRWCRSPLVLRFNLIQPFPHTQAWHPSCNLMSFTWWNQSMKEMKEMTEMKEQSLTLQILEMRSI